MGADCKEGDFNYWQANRLIRDVKIIRWARHPSCASWTYCSENTAYFTETGTCQARKFLREGPLSNRVDGIQHVATHYVLHVPLAMTHHQVMELVELVPVSNMLIGLPGVNGLSVEQRKRLTIAVELVANPSVVYMDEPTSGANQI